MEESPASGIEHPNTADEQPFLAIRSNLFRTSFYGVLLLSPFVAVVGSTADDDIPSNRRDSGNKTQSNRHKSGLR